MHGKYERIVDSQGFSILTLRQAQGERIEKRASGTLPSTGSGRSRANGLERHSPDECLSDLRMA
ncbi:MAG: hypothetical protein LBD67_07515 [Candidatus Accumulibacter sp.]|nr:hypothetical protein [Accumulibacter sp.]